MKRSLPVVGLALATAVSIAGVTTASGAAAGAPTADRGGPGKWTKISKSGVGIINVPSLARTSDGLLHVVYSRQVGGDTQISQTAVHTDGSIGQQNDVLPSTWDVADNRPVVLASGNDLRIAFGGFRDINPGFWSDGRMYTATSSSGGSWTLPSAAIGLSHSAYGTYGTGATLLADGTPVAAFPLNSDLTWHVGTGSGADSVKTVASCCVYDTSMVRDGNDVWLAWYGNGSTNATNGVFAMQILPSVGPVLKAPGSSQMSLGQPASIETGRVGLAARAGGGVYAAYCVGYPSCTSVRVWKVGTTKTKDVPHSKFATTMAISSGPKGRLWVTWADNIPKVRAVRTGTNGLTMGAVQKVGLPKGKNAVYSIAIEGSRARGDIVVNVGDSMWHTQVKAGLTVSAAPHKWRHGHKQKVVFTVTDAHDAVKGAKVKVGHASCKTGSHGTCSITFPGSFAKGKHSAKATKKGYAAATTGLRVT